MVRKGKEAAPETTGSQLAKVKHEFGDALRGEAWDGDLLTRSFNDLEVLSGKATKESILTPGEHLDEMFRITGLAGEVAAQHNDVGSATFFAAKNQTYVSLREMLAPPAEQVPPQATVTEEREMSGGKTPV